MSDRTRDIDAFDPELLASLALDDEIEHDELLALLDAMAREPRCRDFWRAARSTQQLIDRAEPARVAMVPLPAWRRPRRWAAAAIVVLGLGVLGWGAMRSSPTADTADASALNVRLGEDGGAMDDERFVEIAVELLRADRRYHEEMVDLLDDVHAPDFVSESSSHERRKARETRIARSEIESDFHRAGESALDVPAAF